MYDVYTVNCNVAGDYVKVVTGNNGNILAFQSIEVYTPESGNLRTYPFTALKWKRQSDYRFTASVPENSVLCGVKLGSNDWNSNGVTSLWMKWCDKSNWSLQTDGRLWQNQPAQDFGANGKIDMTFGDSDCNTN